MGNIVKIVLALNILAAGAGIFFGVTKKGAIGDLQESAQTAKQNADKAQGTVNDLKTKFTEKDEEFKGLKKLYDGLSGTDAQQKLAMQSLSNAKSQAETALQIANNSLTKKDGEISKLKQKARSADALQAQLTDFQNLGLTAAEIQERLVELQQLKDASKPPPAKKKPKPKVNFGEIGKVGQWDAANQFGVFQAGADNGIKVGDKFTIFRGGTAIGKIVVQRVTPVLSVFKADPAFGQPQSPYKIGDSVMKTN